MINDSYPPGTVPSDFEIEYIKNEKSKKKEWIPEFLYIEDSETLIAPDSSKPESINDNGYIEIQII